MIVPTAYRQSWLPSIWR